MIKRLGVFVFYEKDGIVRDYVLHILNEVKKHISELVIVCNGKLADSGRHRLESFTEEIYIRENTGFDAAALKYFFCEKMCDGRLDDIDEVLIFNHTFYGPFGGFDEVFDKMSSEKCDFWGLSDYNANERFPYHIQSYFVNFKSQVVHSDCFMAIWKKLKYSYADFLDCVRNYEIMMTVFLTENGFIPSAYVKSKLDIVSFYAHPYEMMVKDNYPIVKRKCFNRKSYGGVIYNYQLAEVMEYTRINYPMEYLYMCEDILRSYDICTIKNYIGLNIVPEQSESEKQVRYSVISDTNDFSDLSFDKNAVDSHVTLIYKNDKYNLSIHDKIVLYDNIYKDEDYVHSILKIFESRPEIGCILPATIVNKDTIRDFFKSYVSYGCFWIRDELLNDLMNDGYSVDDLSKMNGDDLARLVQKYRYFTYTVDNASYELADSVMKDFIIKELLFHLERNYDFESLSDIIKELHGDRLHRKRLRTIIKNKVNKGK